MYLIAKYVIVLLVSLISAASISKEYELFLDIQTVHNFSTSSFFYNTKAYDTYFQNVFESLRIKNMIAAKRPRLYATFMLSRAAIAQSCDNTGDFVETGVYTGNINDSDIYIILS